MMTKQEAEKFLILVNNPEIMGLLSTYADHRIAKLTTSLLNVQTIEELKAIQHSVQELRRLKGLREEVNNPTGD